MAIKKDEFYYATKLRNAALRYDARVLVTPSYAKKWRQHSAYKYWAISVIRRDGACRNCGTTSEKLHAHHIEHATYRQELRFTVENGITLCYTCHMVLHNKLAGGYRKMCGPVHVERLAYMSNPFFFYVAEKRAEPVNEEYD